MKSIRYQRGHMDMTPALWLVMWCGVSLAAVCAAVIGFITFIMNTPLNIFGHIVLWGGVVIGVVIAGLMLRFLGYLG